MPVKLYKSNTSVDEEVSFKAWVFPGGEVGVKLKQEKQGELKEIFRDYRLLVETSLEEIRSKLNEEVSRAT